MDRPAVVVRSACINAFLSKWDWGEKRNVPPVQIDGIT
jgi:hypothetical protein